jgi:hypothetical protein
VLVIDVGGLCDPDVRAVDALARMHLLARRAGCRIELRRAGRELCELVELMGLRGVLRVKMRGESEQREEVLGVEEERDPAEPIA